MKIVKYPNDILRQKSKAIVIEKDKEVIDTLREMKDYVSDAENGAAGLALPQIGISKRGFVTHINKKVEVIINPRIIKEGSNLVGEPEGCLSIDEVYTGKVFRSRKIQVSWLTIDGKMRKEKLTDWDARVFLHEYDHLEGILFIDKIK